MLLQECLLHLEFGNYAFEKVFDIRVEDGGPLVYWRKWATRHPLDIDEWVYDAEGGINGFWMYKDPSTRVYIPIEKAIIFVHDEEGGNVEGISILRAAYKHWYIKDTLYKIDAIQKERHGIGVPVIKLSPNASTEDKALAQEIGRNLRTNEKAHVVLPPGWDILMLKMEGQPTDPIVSIEHHDMMIARRMLAQWIQGTTTSASIDVDKDMFLKAARYTGETVRSSINMWAIPEICQINWGVDVYPELRLRKIGEDRDWRTFSFALRNLIGAGVIVPDDPLEELLREELDLPERDPETARPQVGLEFEEEMAKLDRETAEQEALNRPMPPAPGRTGLPRQSAAGRQQIGPGNSGRVGRDTSGG
jgi:hypothetical protein